MSQSVPAEDLRSSDEQLRSELEEIVAAEDKLTALVQESKADGVLDPDEVVSMWQATVSYLELNPRQAKIAGMQQQLEARIQKAPGKYASFSELAVFWSTRPVNMLSQLPAKALAGLPANVLSQLPAKVLSQLPSNVLSPVIVKMPVKSNSIGMAFKPLPGGTFTMGEGSEAHQVTKAFELGVYQVTQEQYEAVMGTNPSDYKGPQNPVENVSWDDAVEFCRKLSDLPAEKQAGYVYRLPTEAEWEYSCRAGTTTMYSFGGSESELLDYAWFADNSGTLQIDALNIWNTDQDNYYGRLFENNCSTHPVGQKKPNPWGLYDMHGNVWEWCQDLDFSYRGGITELFRKHQYRVLRGGSFDDRSSYVRSADRISYQPDNRPNGAVFRPARTYNLSR